MVELIVRVEDTKRIFLCSPVVSKHQVYLKVIPSSPCYRSDSVVWLSVTLSKHIYSLIRVASPDTKYLICKFGYFLIIFSCEPDNRHRPVYNSCLNILIALKPYLFSKSCPCHREFIVSSLEMVVCKDGAANYREVSIGACHIMRKLLSKFKEL